MYFKSHSEIDLILDHFVRFRSTSKEMYAKPVLTWNNICISSQMVH